MPSAPDLQLEANHDYVRARAARGEVAEFKNRNDKRVSCDLIYELLTNSSAKVHNTGLRIDGAELINERDFSYSEFYFPLALTDCAVPFTLEMEGLVAPLLILTGTKITAQPVALDLNFSQIRGSLLFDGTKTKGEVRLLGADIKGQVSCSGGTFENEGGNALIMDGATVGGGLFLKKRFNANGFNAKGEVRLHGVDIKGPIDCSGGTFENEGGNALSMYGATVGGALFLRNGFNAKGEVRLLGVDIKGQIDCSGGTFENEGGNALSLDGATVGGGLFLNEGFIAKGAVRLRGVDIKGPIDCSGGTFENEGGNALNMNRATVGLGLFLNEGFIAKGEVSLHGVDIKGPIDCSGGTFENEGGDALNLREALVGGSLILVGSSTTGAGRIAGRIILVDARIRRLIWNEGYWPSGNGLLIDGLTYETLELRPSTDSTDTVETAKKWLNLTPEYRPQPYEQLAHSFHRQGLETEAVEISITKQQDLRKRGQLGRLAWTANRFLDLTTRYGWRPRRMFFLALVFILTGIGVFWGFQEANPSSFVVRETVERPDNATTLYPWLYSLDTFIPLVEFGQDEVWRPNNIWLNAYRWIQIAAGWVITTLAVTAFTGVVRRLQP